MLQRTLCALAVMCLAGCGGGEPVKLDAETPGGLIHVKVSVGAPLEGVNAVAYAIDPASGKPIEGRDGGAILAEANGASASGELFLKLAEDASWDGPIQIVVSGSDATYTDPTSDTALTKVSLPGSFQLSSYLQNYRSGTDVIVPVTLWTSLADSAVNAYAQGRNPSSTTKLPVEQAMALMDELLSKHISRPTGWDLRATPPVSLNGDVGGLRDVVYAALPDLALNQMARDISISIGQQPGTNVTAYTLLELLRKDLSDGLFDGKQEGVPLTSGGSPAYALTADTTRLDMAKALDTFVASGTNRTGLTRKGLQEFGVFDNIAMDQSILYPQDEAPTGFDNVPPTVEFKLSFRTGHGDTLTPAEAHGAVVTGNVTVSATANDPSGVAHVKLELADGRFLTLSSETTNSRFVGSFDVSSDPDGPLRFVATAVDMIGNTGQANLDVEVDNSKPVLNVSAPVAGTFYSGSLPVEATAVDPHVSSLSALGLAGFVDTVAAPERVKGSVEVASYEDGPIPVHLRACDAARNCEDREVSVAVDNTMPTIELEEPLPEFASHTPFVVRVFASDQGAGVKAVKGTVRGGAPLAATRDGDAWVFNFELEIGPSEVVIWAEDNAVPVNSGLGEAVTGNIVRDATPPSLNPVTLPAYKSEAGAGLVVRDEMPVVPAELELIGEKVDLNVEPLIQKTFVSSTWGELEPSGAELEGKNPLNLPFRQFSVGYDPETESPIASVTWRIRASINNFATFRESTGNAIQAARPQQGGNLFYNVVFSRETIPFLSETTARKTELWLWVKATDLAGNAREIGPFAHSYEMLDTPLHYVLDSGYQATAELSSIYGYRLSSDGYQNLFISDGNDRFPGTIARLARVRVYNPWAEAVAIQQTGNFKYTIRETWLNDLKAYPANEVANGVVHVDGHPLRQFERYDSIPDSGLQGAPGCTSTYNNSGSVCGRGWQNSKHIAHENGSNDALVCLPSIPESSWSKSLSSSHASALYYLPGDREVTTVSGAAVVPAFEGQTPGEVVVYPGVLRSGLARDSWEYPFQSLVGFVGPRYQKLMGALYTAPVQMPVCSQGGPPPLPTWHYYLNQYELKKWAHALSASKSSVTSGELAFSARPIYAAQGGARLTGPAPSPKTVPFTLNFDH